MKKIIMKKNKEQIIRKKIKAKHKKRGESTVEIPTPF